MVSSIWKYFHLGEPSIPKWQLKTSIWHYERVGLGLKTGLWRYAVIICILFPDIELRLITSQTNHAQSIIPIPKFFNCVTNFTALAHVSVIVRQTTFSQERVYSMALTCTLTCNVKNTTFSIFTTYTNRPPNGSIQSILITNKIDVFDPHPLCHTFPSRLYPPSPYVTLKKVTYSYDDMS